MSSTDSTATTCAAWTGYPRTWHCWCGQCFCGNVWCLTKTNFWGTMAIGSYYEFSKLLNKKHKRNQSSHCETSIIWKLEKWLTTAASHQPWYQQYGTSLRHTFLGSLMAVLVPSLAKTARILFHHVQVRQLYTLRSDLMVYLNLIKSVYIHTMKKCQASFGWDRLPYPIVSMDIWYTFT